MPVARRRIERNRTRQIIESQIQPDARLQQVADLLVWFIPA